MKYLFCITFLMGILSSSWSQGLLLAADKWVGPGGSNSNSGTSVGQRWGEFTYAVKNLEPGDTLHVMDGHYVIRNEVDNYNGIASVRRTGFTRLDGWTNAVTTIKAVNPGQANVHGNLNVRGSFITIEGLNVFGDGGNLEPGFLIEDSHHISVTNNEVAYCGGGGINFNHSDCIRVIGNQVHHNCSRNPQQHSGISIYQPIEQIDPENRYWSIEICRNTCYDNVCWTPGHLGHTDGNGIIMDDYFYTQSTFLKDYHYDMIRNANSVGFYTKRTLVEANLCNYNGGAGIRAYQTFLLTIKNNTVIGNNRLFYYWEDGGYDPQGYYNAGNLLLENTYSSHILNNVCLSDYQVHAPNNSNFAASDQWGAFNLWENNLLSSKLTFEGLWNSHPVGNRAFYGDPSFANEASYDYRSLRGYGLGIRWPGHTYVDLYGRRVEGGGRVDLGAIQVE